VILFSGALYGQKKPAFLSEIQNIEEFNSLMGQPNTSKFSQVEAIKVLYQLSTKKTYYINSANHDYHSTFCQQSLGYPRSISDFNLENYTRVENRGHHQSLF
jgi:pyruvate, water dikinase